MKNTKLRIILIVAAVLLVGIIIAVTSIGKLRGWALHKASDTIGREITLAEEINIDWGWPITRVHLSDLKISNFDQGSAPEMASADNIFVSINVKSLLKFDVVLPEVILEKPVLLLEKDKQGNANWKFTDNGTSAAAVDTATPDDRTDIPEIGRLLIKNGQIIYKDKQKNTDVTLAADTIAGSANKSDQLHLKGKGNYQGQNFILDMSGGTIFELQENKKPYPLDITLDVGNTHARVNGTVTDPIKLTGMNAELNLRGRDAAELFHIVGMALPPTPPYDIKGKLNYIDKIWRFNNFNGKMGTSDLGGSVSWNTNRKRPLLSGDFVSQKLDFKDLGGLVGAKTAIAQNKDASAKQKSDAARQQASPYVIPDTPLDISRLSAMDAKVTFTGKKLVSPSLPLDDFYMKVDLENSLLKLLPVRFGTASGNVEAYLTVNARKEPVNIDADFRFRRLSLKPFFEAISKKLGKPNFAEGYIGGTAKLSGQGKSLRTMLGTSNGDIGIGMEGGRLSGLIVEVLGLDVAEGLGFFIGKDEPVPIRCVVGDFGVKNGLMKVRHFVIDTEDSNIQGTGAINLKNEAMDLELRTYPKDNSLVSLNSPIGVTGTMKNPKPTVDVRNVAARGAVAVAAGLIALPAAAIAFVEAGLGEDSHCGKLIRQMNQNNGNANKNLVPRNK